MRSEAEILSSKYLRSDDRMENAGIIYLKDSGKASVIWGRNESGWEHVSVAPYSRKRMPSWDDMCRVKDTFWTEEEACVQFMPRKREYVNVVNNCLHIWRRIEGETEMPPGVLV